MPRRLELALLFAAGLATVAWGQAVADFDGEYVGELTLRSTISGDCTQPPLAAVYPLIVSKGQVRFSYVPHFATTLTGQVDKDGRFEASARLKHGIAKMIGEIRGRRVTASIISPSCNYTFQTIR